MVKTAKRIISGEVPFDRFQHQSLLELNEKLIKLNSQIVMNDFQKKFIYLTQIINIPIIDSATGKKVGRTIDVVAGLREIYPKVNALIARSLNDRKKI